MFSASPGFPENCFRVADLAEVSRGRCCKCPRRSDRSGKGSPRTRRVARTGNPSPARARGAFRGKSVPRTPSCTRGSFQSVPIQPDPVDTGAYCAALIAAFSPGPLVQQSNPCAQGRRARTAGPPALPTVNPLPQRAGQAHADPVNACGRTWRRSRCPSRP